jgi:hypothetical protein
LESGFGSGEKRLPFNHIFRALVFSGGFVYSDAASRFDIPFLWSYWLHIYPINVICFQI